MAEPMDEREVEAVARALHRQFWIRTYGAETGTAAYVTDITWHCVAVREARMDDALSPPARDDVT